MLKFLTSNNGVIPYICNRKPITSRSIFGFEFLFKIFKKGKQNGKARICKRGKRVVG